MNRLAALAVSGLLGVGCSTARIPKVPGDPPPALRDGPREVAYQTVLERYTSSRAIYDLLDTRLFVQATWQAPAFVEARLSRVREFRALSTAEAAVRRDAELARLDGVTEFFVGIHANDSKLDDLDRGDSQWSLALVTADHEASPIAIERLGRSDTQLRSVYSYMESFWVGYRVRFARVELRPGQSMTLRVSSAVGRAELAFTARD
jgi:hypothetical protein